MSDYEESDYYSEGENDSDQEEIPKQKKITIKIGGNDKSIPVIDENNIDEYNSDSEISEDDGEVDDDVEVEEANIQVGGVGEEEENVISDIEDEDAEISDDEDDDDETKQNKIKKKAMQKIALPIIDDIEYDEEEEEYDETYLQKFDSDLTKNYINEFHPECLIHNYDEISKLTTVVRDSFNIIIDPLHRTIPFLTKYERARILGQRAKQIEIGARPFIHVPENVIDGYVIAELELQQKRIPFIIRRPIPGGGCEYWNLKDLEVISF